MAPTAFSPPTASFGPSATSFAPPADSRPTRVSDSERERTVALLREHWMAGRLTVDEFEARCAEAWQARYVSELWTAVRELPIPPAPPVLLVPARPPEAVVSFALGMTGAVLLLLSFGLLSIFTLPLTTIAWVQGRRVRRGDMPGGRGLALTGEVLGIVGTVFACLALAACGVVVAVS